MKRGRRWGDLEISTAAALIGDDVTRLKPLIWMKIASETADRVTRERRSGASGTVNGRDRPGLSPARRD